MKSNLRTEIQDAIGLFDRTLEKNHALESRRTFSEEKMAALRAAFLSEACPTAGVGCVAVAGSLARRDASPESDVDLVTIIDDRSAFQAEEFHAFVDQACKDIGLQRSNPRGVFAKPVLRTTLTTTAGSIEENYMDLSKRVLLVLESDWVWDQGAYDALITDIVSTYADDVSNDCRKNFVFLLNDIVRYFRTICVNYQHSKDVTEYGKWPLRNVKLRHSRVIMYFSLVLSIGLLSKYREVDKTDVLKDLIALDPMQRIFAIYEITGDSGFFRVAGYYNTFMELMGDATIREELVRLEYNERYHSPNFSQLKSNSDALAAELNRFYRARHGEWDERFFEYMIL